MRKEIKLFVNIHGEIKLIDIYAENYDEFTYIVSLKFKENIGFKGTKLNLCDYCLVDKLTGLSVVSAAAKKDLIYAYDNIKAKYEEHRKSDVYKMQIRKYEEMVGTLNESSI